jgi:uncharacterized protein YciI
MTIGLPPGTYQLLTYEYVPDILERRDPHRAGHLAHAAQARQRGELVAVGAVGSPPTGALLVFADVDPAVLEHYAHADPYQQAGLVTGHHVAPWTVVG